MSDTGRQGFGDRIQSNLKPDSEKSFSEQAKDKASGTYDSAASTLQPDDQKSYTQQAMDSLSGNQNENSSSMLDKAKETFGLNK